tara:strand:- start:7101 stop:7838 length:738 start_codon:yes stop_codon:yes gene_type:complete
MSLTNLLKDSFNSFKQHWLISIGVVFIYYTIATFVLLIISFLIGFFFGLIFYSNPDLAQAFAQGLNQFVQLIFLTPAILGFYYFSFNVSRDSNPGFRDMLFGYKQKWIVSILTQLALYVVFLGYMALAIIIGYGIYTLIPNIWLMIFYAILISIPCFVISLMFSQVWLIITDNDEVGVIEAFSISMKIMQGYKTKYFLLQLILFFSSFLFTILTCGFGLIALIPYLLVVQCKFHDYIKKNPVSTS